MSPDFADGTHSAWATDEGHLISAAQARRDRERLAKAQAQIDALRLRIGVLEGRLLYRGKAKLVHGLKFGLNKANAVQRRLRRPADAAAASSNSAAEQPVKRGRALVIDHHWPTPDRDSGSIDIVTMVKSLQSLGFDVILAAARQHDGLQPARQTLMADGINCLEPGTAPSVGKFVAEQGGSFDLVVLCRVYCGGEFLELAQKHCHKARIVFNSIDLCFMRVERQARLLGDAKLIAVSAQIRKREEELIESCDATIVVSQVEFELLARTHPKTLTEMLPLTREISPPATAFAERRNIGFIGGFAHAPNIDAVRMFLQDVWPKIQASIPDCGFDIVGADAPADLLDGVTGKVRLLGHMPNVQPWFESLRLTVAPLRYGAGAKGKVASSLAAGVPCVVTQVAAEGMMLGAADGVIVANDADAFANAVLEAYGNAEVWQSLSEGGIAYAKRSLSLSRWQNQLDRMLVRIGL